MYWEFLFIDEKSSIGRREKKTPKIQTNKQKQKTKPKQTPKKPQKQKSPPKAVLPQKYFTLFLSDHKETLCLIVQTWDI